MGWQSTSYTSGTRMVLPYGFIDKYSWANCPSQSDRGASKLGKQEVSLATAASGSDEQIEEIVVTGSRLRSVSSPVILVDVSEVEENSDGLRNSVSRERHQFLMEGVNKDGSFGGDTSMILTSDFAENVGFAWKYDEDGFALRSLMGLGLRVDRYYNDSGSSIDVGDAVTLDGAVVDGLATVRTSDGTAAGEFDLGIALETAADGASFAVSTGYYTPIEFISGASIGDKLYVDASGLLTTTVGSNRFFGELRHNPADSLTLGLAYRISIE